MEGFARYEHYKDSGVPWLGKIPNHWQVIRAKYILREVDERSDDGAEELLSVSHLTGVTPRKEKNVTMFLAEDYSDSKICQKNDIVINTMWAWMGALGCSPTKGLVSPSYGVYRPSEKIHPQFLDSLLRTSQYVAEYNRRSTGIHSSRLRLYPDQFLDIPLLLPPVDDQIGISKFIDQKTAEIDEAINKKKRLIELLKEQKAILINQVVTKGPNPDAPMRDSGMEWIGSMPEHWEVRRLKHLFAEVDERSKTGEEILLSLRMYSGLVPHTEVSDKFIPPPDLIGYKHAHPGQLVMNRMRAAIGLFAVAKQKGLVSPDYAVFNKIADVDADYYLHLFKTSTMGRVFRLESKGLGTGSSGFLRLYSDRFGMIKVPIPPKSDQVQIVSYIEKITTGFEQATEKVNKEITLLNEFKSIIISNAVTGKIKV
jgi:type I restriction enzyme S subunit